MKKIKDFIYDYNDIVVVLVVFAIAGFIIFWRVDGIMAYSSYLESKQVDQNIDIDFSDIDLDPITDDTTGNTEDEQGTEEGEENSEEEEVVVKPSPDRNFISTEEVSVVIPKGAGCEKIGKCVAEAYEFVNEDNKTFISSFTELAKELKLETKMHYGTFKIAAGSSMEDIIKKLAHIN